MSIQWKNIANDTDGLRDFAYTLLRAEEPPSDPAKFLLPHLVGSNITIGIGLDLKAGKDSVRDGVMAEMGLRVDLRTQDISTMTATDKVERGYIDKLLIAFKGADTNALDRIMQARASDPLLSGVTYERRSKFKFNSEDEVRAAFRYAIGDYDIELTKKLAFTNGTGFDTSREKAVLLSLSWNAPSLVGNSMISALRLGNRAEAWYQIRYGWKDKDPKFNNGWAKRHYLESDIFGLYDDSTNVRPDEAKDAYRMLQLHRDRIQAREDKYGKRFDDSGDGARNMIAEGNADSNYALAMFAAEVGSIPSINEALTPAKVRLLADLGLTGMGISADAYLSTDIYLGADSSSIGPNVGGQDTLMGSTRKDILIGQGGADILNGGAGNDFLIGGTGNDTLKGGTGDDTYVYKTGDGQDTIDDSDGQGKILIAADSLSGTSKKSFIEQYRTQWESADGALHYTLLDGNLKDGGTLEITGSSLGADGKITIKHFKNDQLGIHLNSQNDIALLPSGEATPFTQADASAQTFSGAMAERGSRMLKVALNQAARAGDKIILKATGGNASLLSAIRGDDTISFSGGQVELTLQEGQTEIAFAVANTQDADSVENYTLSATFQPADPDAQTATADYTLTLNGVDEAQDPQTTLTLTGDINPTDIDPSKDGIQAQGDAQGNPIGDAQPYEDILSGSAGNDHILSGELNDDIGSGAGDDWIEGGGGSDYIHGETGNDLIEGGTGSDILIGEDGNDRLYANAKIDTAAAIDSDSGNNDSGSGQKGDWLSGNAGDDTLVAGADNDVLAGGAGADLLIAGAGDDNILGDADYTAQFLWESTKRYTIGSTDWYHSSADTFNWGYTDTGDARVFAPVTGETDPAGGGADVIYAGAGDDHVWAGEGDDVVYGEGGADTISGEAGNDVLLGGAGDDKIWGDSSSIDESLHGDDFIDGGDGNDELYGMGGNDTLYGGAGDDKLYGDQSDQLISGNNYLNGEDGNDTLWGGKGDDTLLGGAGDDNLYGGDGTDYLDGGDGADTLQTTGGNSDLNGGAGNDDLSAFNGGNYLDGGDGNDTLWADGGNNTLFGGAGNDTLSAGGGNNYLDGEDGNNTMIADGGNNTLFGGAGDDTLSSGGGGSYLDGGDGTNTLIADGGNNTLFGGSGDDTLSSSGGNSYLDGGDGTNTLIADGGANTLIGGSGADTLSSGGGGSYLDGGDGNDVLIADGGNNTLIGGAGDDFLSAAGGGNTMDGGDGNDIYAFDIGFGENHIVDADFGNTAQFNFSFAGSGIIVGLGSLKLSFASGDVLHIDGFDPEDPLNTCAITTFQFNDRTLSLQDILDIGGPEVNYTIGPDINGTPNDDVIQGTDRGEHIYALDGNDTIDAGAGNDTVEGGAGNDIIDGGTGADVMTGGVGNDTYYVDNAGDRIIEDVGQVYSYTDAQGHTASYVIQDYETVNASISYALGDNLEILNLTGTDNIDGAGNAQDNYITGNDGNNILSGGAGDDWLLGGAGDDTLSGGTGDDVLVGEAGTDAMAGGAGNDVYLVDDASDVTTESLNEGTDTVQSTVSYTLGANIENLNLSGTDNINGIGNALDNWINGNSGDNLLDSGAGDDILNGFTGVDTMVGGAGDDTYYVDDSADVIVENADEGVDSVFSTAAYSLSDNVENLFLNGLGNIGTGNAQDNIITGYNDNRYDSINYVLSGGAGNDTLTGNIGNDVLDGGSGVDVMDGGLGGDTYVVDNAGDQVIENLAGQTYAGSQWVWTGYGYQLQSYSYTVADADTVDASITYTLGNNLENLYLFGSDSINGTGNELDNIIFGNDGNNILVGWAGNDFLNGGAGVDVMDGGAGNDTYVVDNVGDQVIDAVAGQIYNYWWGSYFSADYELVYSSVTFTLPTNIEDLYLTGSDDIDGTGNTLNNNIYGNAGANTLVGDAGYDYLNGGDGNDILYGGDGSDQLDGGAGADVMDGGAGDDTYVVDNVGDTAIESSPDGGWDSVSASADFTLGANIENLQLTGNAISGTGNELDNQIQGNDMGNALFGLDGNDYLDGGAGNDTIAGGEGNDNLFGGSDNGDNPSLGNSDILDGEAGDDTIDGGSGNDLIYGGTGDDNLFGGYDGGEGGNFLTNDDTIYGGDGDDTINGGSGADKLYGGAGNDVMYGGDNDWNSTVYDPVTGMYVDMSNADTIDGGEGDDTIDGQAGDDLLSGGAGDDAVYGGDGNDTLDGGTGLDFLVGGQGNDVYVVDGSYVKMADVPTVTDCGHQVLTEQLVWTTDDVVESGDEGYDIVYSNGSYALSDNVEELRLTFDPAMMVNDPQRYADFLAFGQNGYGNDLDNMIVGSELANRLEGGAGDDILEGGAGNDTLVGDAGNDTLLGGAGDDRYVFRLGDGADTIVDNQGSDTLHIGSGLTLADLLVVNDNGNIAISILGTDDSIVLNNWFGQTEGVSHIKFCDGTVLDRQGIASMTNSPIPGNPLPDQITLQDNFYTFTIPADTFSYTNGDTLSYSATMADGEPLPFWLALDAATGVFSGTPDNWDVSTLNLKVTATNAAGNAASSNFVLDVLNVNDAPTVVSPLVDQVVSEGQAFSFTASGQPSVTNGFMNDPSDNGTPQGNGIAVDAYLWGSVGNNAYSFARGDGGVYVWDWDQTAGNVDTVQFSPDLAPADISIGQDQWGNVVLSVNGTSDSLTLQDWLYSDANKIERLVFADGTVWGVAEIMSMVSTSHTPGNDYLVGTEGNDVMLGGAGDDLLMGSGGGDILAGGSGADYVVADTTYADLGNDLLSGGAGDDSLDASISNDLLIGGAGNDEIYGNDGNDVLLFNRGDGNDWYGSDWSSNGVPIAQRTDTVSLGGGIAYADLSFERSGDDLILHVGNDESITFSWWFNTDDQDNKAISRLQFITQAATGYDALSSDPLLNKQVQQFDFVGLANQFEAALAAAPGISTWQLAPHLADFYLGGSDIQAIGGDMAYLYGTEGNLDRLSEAELRAELASSQFGVAPQALAKTGGNTFADIDAIYGDTLTYTATLADGSPLPSWLNFDPATQTFSGTPGHGNVGTLNVSVIATDTGGLSASTNFLLNVNGIPGSNTAPVLATSLSDQSTLEDALFTFTIPADTFIDVGDTLTYSATLADGNSLPAWLGFDGATGTFSGTPDNWDVGSLNVTVTATDSGGLATSSSFALDVVNVNDAPTVVDAPADQVAIEGQPFSFAVPVDTFNDDDFIHGDSLSYSATLADGTALPSWLSFDATTGTFSGTPLNGDVGNLSVAVTATDTGGLTASSVFKLSVANVNDAPIAAIPLEAQTAMEDASFSYALPAGAFSDIDVGDTLTYSAALQNGDPLPSWLSFDAATRTFAGMPANSDVGVLGVVVTATDSAGATAAEAFDLTVLNVNDAPVVVAQIDNHTATQDQPFAFSIPAGTFNDDDFIHGDSLTYSATLADGTPLPTWLGFDGATGTFSGTPANGDVGTIAVAVTATDLAGASATTVFGLAVANVNDAPVSAVPLADQTTLEDALFSFTLPANAFTDIDRGDSLSFGFTLADGTALPTWLSFDAATRTLSGTPANEDVGSLPLKVTATDGAGASASQVFALDVLNVNDAPYAVNSLLSQAAAEDAPFTYTLPDNAFADVDVGDVLSYSATLQNGDPLPSWLSFDGSSRTFTGTPANGDVGVLNIAVSATDLAGASASQTFTLDIANVNDAPQTAEPIPDQAATEDAPFTYTLSSTTFLDVDAGDTLHFGATLADGTSLPSWLTFDGATLTFGGTPTNDDVGILSLRVTATDNAGADISDVFDLTVANVNDAPILVTPLADQAAKTQTAFTWQMPAGSFTDVDKGDTLTYSARMADGNALPNWLAFDAATQTFSGTAPANASGTFDIQLTATDGAQATASDVFRLTVAKGSQGGCDHGHGNEGVGNGWDNPPPGHDWNHNDGPGTSPGHPGCQGGHDGCGDSKGHGKHDDKDKVASRIDGMLGRWFDQCDRYQSVRLSQYDDIAKNGGKARGMNDDEDGRSYAAQWQQLHTKLDAHFAAYDGDLGATMDHGHLSEGMGGLASGGKGNDKAQVSVPLNTLGKGGMQSFNGLREGLAHLGW